MSFYSDPKYLSFYSDPNYPLTPNIPNITLPVFRLASMVYCGKLNVIQ